MPDMNRISVTITDQNVTDAIGHIEAIAALFPFLLSRDKGDDNVMLGEKSVGFDEKAKGYMETNPEFNASYIAPAEVLKDRGARAQFLKFLPSYQLLGAKLVDSFNVIGNEIMMADLAYYNNTAEAANRGIPNAGDIHRELASRYPGRPAKAASAPSAPTPAK